VAFPRRSPRTPRSRFTLALLVLTAATLLVMDLPGTGPLDPVRSALASVLRPVRSAGDALARPLSNGWKGAFGYGELKDENERLKAQLAGRKSEQARVDQLRRQVADLNKLLAIDTGADVKTRSAQVVSGPLSSFDHTVQIDQGTSRDVKRGMAVIVGGIDGAAEGGQLMGRITKVRSHSATVELLTEPSFQVGVRKAGGPIYTARGQGREEGLVVEGVAKDDHIARGDDFETSGIDRSAFPPNLQVGRVTSVRATASGDQEVRIEPMADLSSVYVKVALRQPAP